MAGPMHRVGDAQRLRVMIVGPLCRVIVEADDVCSVAGAMLPPRFFVLGARAVPSGEWLKLGGKRTGSFESRRRNSRRSVWTAPCRQPNQFSLRISPR